MIDFNISGVKYSSWYSKRSVKYNFSSRQFKPMNKLYEMFANNLFKTVITTIPNN